MKPELDWLRRWHMYAPSNIALHDVESQKDYSYSQLYHLALALSAELSNQWQVSKGQRVAVMSTNKVEYIILFFALQRLGAIMVPVNFRLTQREVKHILDDCSASLFICSKDFSDIAKDVDYNTWWFEDLQSFVSKEGLAKADSSKGNVKTLLQTIDETYPKFVGEFKDPVMILYTSGTTGAPKGAVITHEMIFWNSINTGLRLNLTEEDVSLCFLPLFHTGGWNVLTTPLLHRGAKLVFLEKFTADDVLKQCEEQQISILFGVPTTMDMLSRSEQFVKTDLKSVRYAIVGGEPMPVPLINTWHEKGVPIRQGYGLTEFGPNVFSLNEKDAVRKKGSIGFPNFYIDCRVVDSEGRECLVDEVGELTLRGPMCMKEYWKNPEATKETIKDGWLYTGDLVRKDSEGYFFVVGRKKEMFISGGENVYPPEVEQVLQSHPAIVEAAVIGVKDEKWGEVGKAFVALKNSDDWDKQDIPGFCREHLAKFKVPKYFEVLPELPKGDSGKILKRSLN